MKTVFGHLNNIQLNKSTCNYLTKSLTATTVIEMIKNLLYKVAMYKNKMEVFNEPFFQMSVLK